MKKLLTLTASCAVLTLAAHSGANAQSIDYATMQELFGEPVTTSATGKPQRASEVPVTMEILTQEDIRRSGAVDLAEVLRKVNGVNVLQTSTQGYDISVRGYNQPLSQRMLVLVNGRQVYLDHYGFTAWSTIPVQLEEIQQIEVVKGPNTALFGFNAVSGVINIVTHNPLYNDESSAGVTVGTQDFRKAHFIQSMKLNDKLGVRVSAGIRRADAMEGDRNETTALFETDGTYSIKDPEQEQINLDALYQLTNKSQLRVELSGSNAQQGDYNILSGFFDSSYETKSAKATYEADTSWGLIKANVYKNYLDWDNNQDADKLDNEVFVAQLSATKELNPKHTVRAGLEYRKNEVTSEGNSSVLQNTGAEISYEVYAASGMWNWKINDKLSWTNALRVDHLQLEREGQFAGGAASGYTNNDFDQNSTEISYNSGLVYQASDVDTLRLSTARGLEVPSLIEFGIDLDLRGAGLAYFTGNPRLEPVVVTNYELAWDRNLDFIDNGLFRSALFYQSSEDVKTIGANVTATGIAETLNIGDSDTIGLELALKGDFQENWNWGLGYIYQYISDDLRNENAQGILNVGKEYEESTPQHQVKFNLGYTSGPWEADALAYYLSGTQPYASTTNTTSTTGYGDVDSYVGFNGRVAYNFDDGVTVAVHGTNIQSADTQTSPGPDIERRLFVSLSKKF
ncbi:MAG: hypothetical protein CBB87_05715 [Micavibrio sp. TMED27]|nr:hypothetical protein [Micavibrio sp.]OUT91515.1 MAG: hypothetical protein CBB87_05715 [Micavibrio sp. TMED27]|tara:strand:- start:1504 stop:3552 length:2049 start_codon:yes stop_codon:yes gene_type:complete